MLQKYAPCNSWDRFLVRNCSLFVWNLNLTGYLAFYLAALILSKTWKMERDDISYRNINYWMDKLAQRLLLWFTIDRMRSVYYFLYTHAKSIQNNSGSLVWNSKIFYSKGHNLRNITESNQWPRTKKYLLKELCEISCPLSYSWYGC